ncbi:hypothetical protein [Mycobacterium asiaticum]|uniref:Uncharacterized protein n=1 Tax=Mycobacterium asiaticum TaxID=1790 RepID=A0A1A3KHL7_MYCAS|nr:hypothetical protein [Mycobacterium asiaticum]OBJ55092.1 hypothetical protein A9W94_20605 [Mycobacterium asiaticum]OBJ84520.1 hypothetical protein A5640_15445 [Mycobacterium asiaticum]
MRDEVEIVRRLLDHNIADLKIALEDASDSVAVRRLGLGDVITVLGEHLVVQVTDFASAMRELALLPRGGDDAVVIGNARSAGAAAAAAAGLAVAGVAMGVASAASILAAITGAIAAVGEASASLWHIHAALAGISPR